MARWIGARFLLLIKFQERQARPMSRRELHMRKCLQRSGPRFSIGNVLVSTIISSISAGTRFWQRRSYRESARCFRRSSRCEASLKTRRSPAWLRLLLPKILNHPTAFHLSSRSFGPTTYLFRLLRSDSGSSINSTRERRHTTSPVESG